MTDWIVEEQKRAHSEAVESALGASDSELETLLFPIWQCMCCRILARQQGAALELITAIFLRENEESQRRLIAEMDEELSFESFIDCFKEAWQVLAN